MVHIEALFLTNMFFATHTFKHSIEFKIHHMSETRQIKKVFFFSIWVFFHEHSRITGLQGKGEGISCRELTSAHS